MNEFSELVKKFVTRKGDEQSAADELRVSTTTIKRWIAGTSTPYPSLQKHLTKYINQELAKDG